MTNELKLPKSAETTIKESIKKYNKDIFRKDLKKLNYKKILADLQKWKEDYTNFRKNIKVYANELNNNEISTDVKSLREEAINRSLTLYGNHLNKGYALIQTIRRTISKIPIEYKILVSVNEENMTMLILNMENMLNAVNFSSEALLNDILNDENEVNAILKNENIENVKYKYKEIMSSKLYNSLVFFFYNGRKQIKNGIEVRGRRHLNNGKEWVRIKNSYSFNRGRIFEVHQNLLLQSDVNYDTYIDPDNTPLYDDITREFFKARKDRVAFFKQAGDIRRNKNKARMSGYELKNISYSDAKLFQTKTVVSTIDNLIKIFNDIPNAMKKREELEDLFTNGNINSKYNNIVHKNIESMF